MPAHTMKEYEGVGVQLHAFLTLALDGSEKLVSHIGHFTSRERAACIH